jgi:hypothetical protein
MKLVRAAFLAGVALVGAACSPPAGQEGAGVAAGGQQGEAAVATANQRLEPGQWRTTITVVEANFPGMPPEMAANIMGAPTVMEECRTSADAETLTQSWVQDDETGCAPGTFQLNGNQFEGEQTCTEDGATMVMRFSGTITPTRLEGVSELTSDSSMGSMSQRASIVSERIGPCAQ